MTGEEKVDLTRILEARRDMGANRIAAQYATWTRKQAGADKEWVLLREMIIEEVAAPIELPINRIHRQTGISRTTLTRWRDSRV